MEVSVNAPSSLTLKQLQTIVWSEERLRANASKTALAPEQVTESQRKWQDVLACVPGMPALRKLLKWAEKAPTGKECQQLEALLCSNEV